MSPSCQMEADSARIIAWIDEWLVEPGIAQASWFDHLESLAGHFHAAAGGLWLVEAHEQRRLLAHYGSPAAIPSLPRNVLGGRLPEEAIFVVQHGKSSWLLARHDFQAGDGWLIGFGRDAGLPWSKCDQLDLTLALLALGRFSVQDPNSCWGRLERRWRRQQQINLTARVAGKLAHDFGNLLTGILGFAELARKQEQPLPLLQGYLKEVWQAAQAGASWVHRLQQMARRGPGSEPNFCRVDQQGIMAARGSAWPNEVDFHFEAPPGLPAVALSTHALHEVLSAVLENACTAMNGRGELRVQVRVRELTETEFLEILGEAPVGPCLEIAIHDSGPGLSAETRQRLFSEPFFSSQPRRRGLGLAVVHGILQAHGGGFLLESSPDHGLTVRLFAPLSDQDPAAANPPAAPYHPASILAVDDDPRILNLLRHTLDQAGYRVQAVSDPVAALTLFRDPDAHYDLVLTDLLMPEMNGLELARKLLDIEPDVRLVFVSSLSSLTGSETEEMFQRYPLVCKPFLPGALLEVVGKALNIAKQTGSSLPIP